ncbi:MAG: O-antigen ligase family protein [Patulibacter sp.]|nr:O-antigen ligase family protein [Patulibacter sp.]
MSTLVATATDRFSWARISPMLLVAALIGAATMVGFAVTHDPRLGVLAAGAGVYVCFVLIDLPLAIGVWIVALYLIGVPGTNGAPTGTTILLVAGCVGTYAERHRLGMPIPTLVRWAYAAAALAVIWSAMTIVWAPDQAIARVYVQYLFSAAVAMPIMISSVAGVRDVLVMAVAFVLGAVALVIAGILLGTASAPEGSLAATEAAAGRLRAGITDPNYLAADIVAALVLSAGLLAVRELRAWRPALLAAIPVLLYGLVATQSRGGFVAAIVAVALSAALLRGYRRQIVAGSMIAILLLAAFLAAQPRALDRLTQDDTTGTGRTEVWRLAVPAIRDHPVGGVGTGNFPVVEGSYLKEIGFVKEPTWYVDTPLVAHNIWIQALVENGVPGLLLLIALVIACVAASFAAGRRFTQLGRPDLAHLGRALGVGQIGSLVASNFISNGSDRVFWIMLTLGPALLVAAAIAQQAQRRGDRPLPPSRCATSRS